MARHRPYNGKSEKELKEILWKRDAANLDNRLESEHRGREIMRLKKISEMLPECEVKNRMNTIFEEFDRRN